MKIKKLSILLIIIFILNLIWEFSHYGLYYDLTDIPANLHLILASFVDVLLVMGIIVFVSFRNKNFSWIKKCEKKDYFFVIVFGLALAFVWELVNLHLERWEYKEIMPTIFSVGLSPLLQLAITGSVGLGILGFLQKYIK